MTISLAKQNHPARSLRIGHVSLLLALLVGGSLATAAVSSPSSQRAAAVHEKAARRAAQQAGERVEARSEEADGAPRQQGNSPRFRPAWERPTPPESPQLVAPLSQEAAIESYFEGGDRVRLARLRAWATDQNRIPEMGLESSPYMYEEHRDHARSLFKELARDYLRQRLGVDAWTESLKARWRARRGGGRSASDRERRPSGPGFDVGPRVRVSDDPELGIEIEGEGSPFLSRMKFTVDQALASGATYGRLSYDDGPRDLELTFAANDPYLGDTVGVGVRFTF